MIKINEQITTTKLDMLNMDVVRFEASISSKIQKVKLCTDTEKGLENEDVIL